MDESRGIAEAVMALLEDPKHLEIAVHPDQKLTDELVLAIAISAPWLGAYFQPGAGG